MADNPVDNKAVDILAAAAGVPTPTQATSVLGMAWRFRKLALLLGGAGLVAAGGGYGYKYFTAAPPKANADSPVVAKADEPKPDDDLPPIMPPTMPVKDDVSPAVAEVKIPLPPMPDGDPIVKPVIKPLLPTNEKADAGPAIVLPPNGDTKKPGDDGPPIIAPPMPGDDKKKADEVKDPAIVLPDGERKKPATEDDRFKAADGVPTIGTVKVGPSPGDVADKTEKTGVIRVDGVTPPAAPKIPDIDIPAPPGAPGITGEKPPTITTPEITVPGPRPDVPPVIINPLQSKPEVRPLDGPTIKLPDTGDVIRPPVMIDPPSGDVVRPPVMIDPPVGTPRIDVKVDTPRPPVASPTKRESYDELWHDDKGETFAAISREYFHDPKYASALEAYNRNRRDKTIRVPPTWVLEEQFPRLINKTAPEKATRPEGLKFEPVAPLASSGRTSPPAAVTNRSNDEYKVTSESGEMIRDVARKALGDSGSWKRLYELNPGIDPTLPIPAGTTLRVK